MPTRKSSRPSYRFLVIESDALFARTLRLGLTSLGHEVEVAHDLEMARRVFEPGRFDVVTTGSEVGMANGLQLAKRLKEVCPQQLIVLLSGYEIHRWSTSDLAGIDLVLTKPFPIASLAKAIAELKTRRARPHDKTG